MKPKVAEGVPTHCLFCGYSFAGLPLDALCPECGDAERRQAPSVPGRGQRWVILATPLSMGLALVPAFAAWIMKFGFDWVTGMYLIASVVVATAAVWTISRRQIKWVNVLNMALLSLPLLLINGRALIGLLTGSGTTTRDRGYETMGLVLAPVFGMMLGSLLFIAFEVVLLWILSARGRARRPVGNF